MMLNPTKVYDQKTKTAIGASNPFYLRQAKKAQPALYDGEELLKTHHVPVIVPSSEEDLELAEITRIKMHKKMNDSASVEKRLKIIPSNYSKENFMATFTPQTQLTPEQVFWSLDLDKQKAEELKANTPTFASSTTCDGVSFQYTCPSGSPNASNHKSSKYWAMKVVFENLEAEVDQNTIDLKNSEIEWKNLLIANENLIVECLSKDVFYTATDYVLNVSRFSDMHDAFTTAQKRPILNLKALVSQNKELTAKLNALHDLSKRFQAKNAKVKQHYKELYDLIKIMCAKTIDQTNSLLTKIANLKAQIKENSKYVTMPEGKPKVLAPSRYPIDVEPIFPHNKNNQEVHLDYIKHLKESVETLHEIVEEAKEERPLDTSLASACCYTQHSQELKKRVTFIEPCETSTHYTPAQIEQQKINSSNALGIPSTGVKGAFAASGSKLRSNTKKDRTLPTKSAMKQVEAHSRKNKSNVKQKNHVDLSIIYKRTIINLNSNTFCKTCNKCLNYVNHDQCVVLSTKFIKQSPAIKVWRVKQIKQVWQATGKLFTTIGHQWQPTGRLLPLGEQYPLTRNTKPKVLPIKQWKPTGRLVQFKDLCPLDRPTALDSGTMLTDPQEFPITMGHNLACTNQQDPNCN
ncbi:hypothetical protein Tco_0064654 [Tanacetum coccineum]